METGTKVIRRQINLDLSGPQEVQTDHHAVGELDDARRHLDNAISSLKDDVVKYQERIAIIERKIADLTKVRGELSSLKPYDSAVVPDGFGEGQRVRRRSLAWNVRREAYLILKQAGVPLNRSEILMELLRRGIEIESPDPAKAVGKILWKAEEFEHRDGGYALKNSAVDIR